MSSSSPTDNDHLQQASHSTSVPSQSDLVQSVHPMTTRLKDGTISRKHYSNVAHYTQSVDHSFSSVTCIAHITDTSEPSHFRLAASQPYWQQAKQEEFDALTVQGTWVLVPPPPNRNIIGSKWIYKVKKNPDGFVSRYKARLVAQGFSQEQGLDYDETFSPVVRHTTARLVLALAAANHWELRQLDVKNAFLHGDLQEDVYMKQPQGFEDAIHPSHVCKLLKSLYGLKQAPRAWNAKFTNYLPTLGFTLSHSDPSLFVKHIGTNIVLLLLYVDDIIVTGSSSTLVQSVITNLKLLI